MKRYLCRVFAAAAMCALLYSVDFSRALPGEVMLFSGRPSSTAIARGVKLSSLPEALTASADTVVPGDVGEYSAELSAFGGLARKRINVRVVEPRTLEAEGSLVGIKLRGAGVIVIGFADFYAGSGLQAGDIILSANGTEIGSYHDFEAVAAAGGDAELRVSRDGVEFTAAVPSVECDDGVRRLGVWVRDSAAGVGTMTFIDRERGVYGALGHGINESDTGVRFPVKKGTVELSRVAGITKGRRGAPGEITGAFVGGADTVGTIEANTDCGIFGRLISEVNSGEALPVALAGEVRIGEAEIICDVGEGRTHYKINIMRLNRLGSASKGILLEITDSRLLALTGGIIQGMSGSPIIQNGAIVGAVTHVLVNNPACGYGVFIENMLACADDIAA